MIVRVSEPPKILLAHSFFLRYDDKQYRRMKPYPPLATLITAAVLRQRGYEVHLFDAMVSDGVDEFFDALDRVDPAIVGIVEDNFNFITKMCTLRMRTAALEMIRASKRRGCMVAVNGSDASDHPESYLEAGADAVMVGEVETTLSDLVSAWCEDRTAPLGEIPGLVLSCDPLEARSALHALPLMRTPRRASLENLDELPFPAWDLIDVERYRKAWAGAHGRLSWNVVTSRGCPYGCNWCAKPLFGRRYAQRAPELVAEELRLLRRDVAPDHVWFADDIFGLTPAWIEEFAEAVAKKDARIPFMMQSRVNLMTPRTVAALADARAEEVWLGVESGSQEILDAMDKGTSLDQVRGATRTLREHGVRSGWFIMLGYLGEEWDDLLLTRDLIREGRPDEIGVSVAYPLPGTAFYDRVQEQLRAKRNWADTDELAMMFQGTYVTEFYHRVRDLLHREAQPGVTPANRHRLDREWTELAGAEPASRAEVVGRRKERAATAL